MNRFAVSGFSVALVACISTASNAQMLNEKVADAAKCSGVILGNALIEFENDNDESKLKSRIMPANYYYLEALVMENETKNAQKYDVFQMSTASDIYDGLTGGQSNSIARLAKCYDVIVSKLSEKQMNEKLKGLSIKATDTVIHNIKLFLKQ